MQMEQLQKDMIAAMKARDKVRKDAISSLVSAAKKARAAETIYRRSLSTRSFLRK